MQFFKGAHFGQGNGTTLLSNLQCSGNEARIDSCGSDGWYKATSYSSCLHNSDAGVVCLRKCFCLLVISVIFDGCLVLSSIDKGLDDRIEECFDHFLFIFNHAFGFYLKMGLSVVHVIFFVYVNKIILTVQI